MCMSYNGLGQMPVPPIPNSARANAQAFPNSRTHLQKVPCQMRHYYL